MAILSTCCCWSSVRKGSFACGIYSMIYFTLISAVASTFLHEDLLVLRNNTAMKPPASFIDPETTSVTSMTFSTIILSFSSLGIVTSVLLLYGIYRDQRMLLIPWIITLAGFVTVDIVHCAYILLTHAMKVSPPTAILFTIDLFLDTLNIYALLCVISQYQELKCGRGRAEDDQNDRIPHIHYSTQPTATSYLSTTRKPVTYTETKPTPTQSPTVTGPQTSIATEEPSPNVVNRGPRKSVKFPDSPTTNGRNLLDPWSMDMTMLLARNSISEN